MIAILKSATPLNPEIKNKQVKHLTKRDLIRLIKSGVFDKKKQGRDAYWEEDYSMMN